MAEEIDFENGRNSNFEGLVTLTLTFDPTIRHIVLQQSSTSTYIPNFIQIEETFCGRTDGRTDGRTFFPSILLGRLSEVDLKILLLLIPNVSSPVYNLSVAQNGLLCAQCSRAINFVTQQMQLSRTDAVMWN